MPANIFWNHAVWTLQPTVLSTALALVACTNLPSAIACLQARKKYGVVRRGLPVQGQGLAKLLRLPTCWRQAQGHCTQIHCPAAWIRGGSDASVPPPCLLLSAKPSPPTNPFAA